MIGTLVLGLLLLLVPASAHAFGKEKPPARNGAYLDASWLGSSTNPDNRIWRTKGTSWKLDGIDLFNAAAFSGREPTTGFRLGFSLGVQTGWDVDNLVPENAISDADWLKYLYYTYLSFLFPVGQGLEVKAGLIPGNLGYENFHAIENPTYTREYGVDLVPYFQWGIWADWTTSETISTSLLVVNGWDYLANTNDVPSYAGQLVWKATHRMQIRQNLYAGPEQANTSLEFWRFVAQTIAEWSIDDFVLVGSIAWASEKQDDPAAADATWWWTALWAQWRPHERWQVTVRPEFYDDPDGVGSGFEQTLTAVTVGGEYRFVPIEMNTLSARLEYRYDRSTGPQGGFYEGDANALTPDQHLFMIALLWKFDTGN